MRFQENEPEEPAFVDALARELASEKCVRCSGHGEWKTAAMVYEGLEWKYYYCYDCRRWFKRHFRYRYAVDYVDDPGEVGQLVRQLEAQKEFLEAQLKNLSRFRRKLRAASSFFQKYLP